MNRADRRAAKREANRTGFELDVPTERACIAYIHPGKVSAAFMDSVMRLRDYELLRTHQLMGKLERRGRAGAIAKSRNIVTAKFLFDNPDADWLLWLDADMGFPASTFHQLRAVADPEERPIVGGLCFCIRTCGFDDETNAEVMDMMPSLQVFAIEDGKIQGFQTWEDYPRNALCRVHATGCACLLVHRSVFERMKDAYGINWFTPIKHTNPEIDDYFGEDTSFCIRAYELDIPIHVHTGVRTSHDKGGIFLTEQRFDDQQKLWRLAHDEVPDAAAV